MEFLLIKLLLSNLKALFCRWFLDKKGNFHVFTTSLLNNRRETDESTQSFDNHLGSKKTLNTQYILRQPPSNQGKKLLNLHINISACKDSQPCMIMYDSIIYCYFYFYLLLPALHQLLPELLRQQEHLPQQHLDPDSVIVVAIVGLRFTDCT